MLAGQLDRLPVLHETDWHDVVHAIHIIQNKLLARPAYRKYLQLAAEQAGQAGEPDPANQSGDTMAQDG